jgi:hypothetical protein
MNKAKEIIKLLEKDVCIVDFNGYSQPGHFPVSFWADWDGSKVVFGGDWQEIPDMPTDKEPTEDEVHAWVKEHQSGKIIQ